MIVDQNDMEEAWALAHEWIASAADLSIRETAQSLLDEVCAELAQLWIHPMGASITRIVSGKKRVLQIVAVGGSNMDEWITEAINEWTEYARQHSCSCLIAVGRPGWSRVYRNHGFEIEQIVATKTLH